MPKDLNFRLIPVAISGLVILLDRLAKILTRKSLTSFDSITIIPGWVRIIHVENPGAAFGFLAEGNPLLRNVVLIGISALVLMFVVHALWSRSSSNSAITNRVALSLILGGAIGNLYDRIVRHSVADFLEVFHGSWSFPAFNVADSSITIGAVLLAIDLLRPRQVHVSAPQDPTRVS